MEPDPLAEVDAYHFATTFSNSGPLNSLQAALSNMDEAGITRGHSVGFDPTLLTLDRAGN
jgi:hypothetical protein